MVTGMVTVWPGLTTTGVKVAAGLVLPNHMSRVGEVTAGSKAGVVAVIDTVAGTGGNAVGPVGPTRNAPMVQSPFAISGAVRVSVEVSPIVDIRSGSPKGQNMSKNAGTVVTIVAVIDVVSEGIM